jgi:hypothetical protein
MTFAPPQCLFCILRQTNTLLCPAFPDGIPNDILMNKVDHTVILPNQTGSAVFIQDPEMDEYIRANNA